MGLARLNFAPFVASRSDISDTLDVNSGIRVDLPSSGDAFRLRVRHGTRSVGIGFGHVVPAIWSLFDEEFVFAHGRYFSLNILVHRTNNSL